MDYKPGITRSIFLHVLAFMAFHGAVFAALTLGLGIALSSVVFYAVATVVVHGGLLIFLLVLRPAFYYLEDGRPMETLGLPNILTLFRITSAPSILVLLMLMPFQPHLVPWLVAYTVLAFVSDFLDGLVSRMRKETSRIGQYLDSSSDYMVLILVAVAFMNFQLLDLWFFVLAMVRFGVQWILVGILFVRGHRGKEIAATWLGKASVFVCMTLFGLAVIQLLPFFSAYFILVRDILFWLEVVVSVILVLSLGEKVLMFVQAMRAGPGAEGAGQDAVPPEEAGGR